MQIRTANLSTVEHANHQTTMATLSRRMNYSPVLNGGGSRGGVSYSYLGGSSAKTALPRVGHPQGITISGIYLLTSITGGSCFGVNVYVYAIVDFLSVHAISLSAAS